MEVTAEKPLESWAVGCPARWLAGGAMTSESRAMVGWQPKSQGGAACISVPLSIINRL